MKKIMFFLMAMLLVFSTAFAQNQMKGIQSQSNSLMLVDANGEIPILDSPTRAPGDVIFSHGFETPSGDNFETGWTSIGTPGGNAWTRQLLTSFPVIEGTRYARILYHASTPHNAWLISPGISLNAGTTYQIKFWVYVAGWAGVAERLEVKIGKSNTAAAMTDFLWDNLSQDFAWTQITVNYVPNESTNYFIGWHAYSPADVNVIAIDAVSVTEAAQNDLEISVDFPYTQIPNFLPLTINANATNVGMATQTGTVLSANLNGANIATSAPAAPIAPGATTTINAACSTPPATGANTLIYTITQNEQPDATPDNNTTTRTFQGSTNGVYAVDNIVTPANGIGSNSGSLTFGNIFEISTPTLFKQIVVAHGNGGCNYTLSLYKMTGDLQCDNVDLLSALPHTSVVGWNTISICPMPLEPGRYFLCVNQLGYPPNVSVSYELVTGKILYVLNPDYSLFTGNSGYAAAIRMILSNEPIQGDQCDPVANLTISVSPACVAQLSWTKPMCGDLATVYNIYRDNDRIAQVTGITTYSDAMYDPSVGHTWGVSVECTDTESTIVTVSAGTCTVLNCDEAQIGNGTGTTYYYPFDVWDSHSYVQEIFTAAELGFTAGTPISELSFQYTNGTTLWGPASVAVYLGHTTKTSFGGTTVSEWIPYTDLTQVWAGNLTMATGWVTINFTSPFVYQGGNIVVAFNYRHGSITSTQVFSTHATAPDYRTLYAYKYATSDPNMYDITNPPTPLTRLQNRNNIKFTACTPAPDVDMKAINISGPATATALEYHNYVVTVKNGGVQPASNFTVKVMTDGNVDMSQTLTITDPLPRGTSTQVTLPVSFPNAMIGEVNLKGRVDITGDANLANNETQLLPVNVIPYGLECIDIEPTTPPTTSTSIPFTWCYNSGVAQVIYLESEIGLEAGQPINQIKFKYNATVALNVNNNANIYIASTTLNTLSSWIPMAQFQLVFSGPIVIPTGNNYECVIDLNPPYIYQGDNLCLMTEKPMVSGYNCSVPAQVFTVTPASRSRYYQSDSQAFNWTQAGTPLNTIPLTSFCTQTYKLDPTSPIGAGVQVVLEPETVSPGGDAEVKIYLTDDCKYITGIYVNGVNVPLPPAPISYPIVYPVYDLNAHVYVEVYTLDYEFDVALSCSQNGHINKDGIIVTSTTPTTLPIECATDELFYFVPDRGYRVAAITDNGIPKNPTRQYVLQNVHDSHNIYVEFEPCPANDINFTVVGEGSIWHKIIGEDTDFSLVDVSEPLGICSGTTNQFLFEPEDHYYLAAVFIDGVFNVGATMSGSYIFANISANHNITVVFQLETLNIIATAGPNGAIDPSGTVAVPWGTDKRFNFTPGNGYVVEQVYVDNVPVPSAVVDGFYEFFDVQENHTIHVTFTQATLYIHATFSGCGNSTISPNGWVPVTYNHHQMITFAPEIGCKVIEVLVDGVSYPNAIPTGSYTFYYVTQNHTIHVTFDRMTYPITANCNGNGYVLPQGVTYVPHGDDKLFTFHAMQGYEIAHVFIDGYDNEAAAQAGEYTFVDVTGPHTIDVVIAPITYTISASVGGICPGEEVAGQGIISPVGDITVGYGSSKVFTFTPAAGSEICKVLVDGIEDAAAAMNGSYAFVNVLGNHTIEVFFKLMRFQMKAVAYANGSIDPMGITEVYFGDDMTYHITPDNGYKISFVLVNGKNKGAIDTYTFYEVDADGIIEAFFNALGIEESTLDGISVYSHSNVVYILNDNLTPIKDASILDMYGRVVWQGTVYERINAIPLEVANGIYVVRVSTDNSTHTTRVPIQR